MSEQERATVSVNAMQADYFRGYLRGERCELASELANHVKRLTRCMTAAESGNISDIRRWIRSNESKMRAIDRMITALDWRFPEAADHRRG
jgi:hypothetical protein